MNDIKELQTYIDEANYIVFFGGAGVSTESGIKDFRGKDGLYKAKNDYGYPPEYLLSHSCLVNKSKVFFDYYRNNMNCLDVEPNITHKYLKKLEDSNKLKAIVTQNIDGLHQKAGSKCVLELHGTIYKNYCMNCLKEFPSDYIFKSSDIPKCECGGIVRPDVVLYGESLPVAFTEAIDNIMKADLMIVAGTSLTVAPASSLLSYFRGNHLVIINDTETPYDRIANLVIHKSLKDVFSKLK